MQKCIICEKDYNENEAIFDVGNNKFLCRNCFEKLLITIWTKITEGGK